MKAPSANITVSYRLSMSTNRTHPMQVMVGFGGLKDEQGKYLRLHTNTGITLPETEWNETRRLPKDSTLVHKLVKLEQAIEHDFKKLSVKQIQDGYKQEYLKQDLKDLIDVYIYNKTKQELIHLRAMEDPMNVYIKHRMERNLEESPNHYIAPELERKYTKDWLERFKEFNYRVIDPKGRDINLERFFDMTYTIDDKELMVKTDAEVRVEQEFVDNYPVLFYEYILKVAGYKQKQIKNKLTDPRLYKNLSNKFQDFDPNMTLGRMTDSISLEFTQFVKDNYEIKKQNSIGSIIKCLRAVLTYAKKKDKFSFPKGEKAVLPRIDVDDEDIYGKIEEDVSAVYLSEKRIDQLAAYKSKNSTREYVAHLAAINAVGFGARFSDIHKMFNVEQGTDTKGNQVWLVNYKDNKTGKEGAVPISNEVKTLIDRYETFEDITSKTFNEEIKEVCKELGFIEDVTHSWENLKPTNDKDKILTETRPFHDWVSSHTFRRSFCTNNWLKGTPNWVIMQFSKHKEEETFLKYVKAAKLAGMQSYIDTFKK